MYWGSLGVQLGSIGGFEGGYRAVPERGGVWEAVLCFLDLSETWEGKSGLVRNLVTKYHPTIHLLSQTG